MTNLILNYKILKHFPKIFMPPHFKLCAVAMVVDHMDPNPINPRTFVLLNIIACPKPRDRYFWNAPLVRCYLA